MTGNPNCLVRVSLINSIQVNARFAMSLDEFHKNDGATKFVNRMCALMGINDTSRVKIVGIYTGSVSIIAVIEPPMIPLINSTQNDKISEYGNVT